MCPACFGVDQEVDISVRYEDRARSAPRPVEREQQIAGRDSDLGVYADLEAIGI
jgi:hypothetical protein